jgi:hypothetical protein
LGPCAPIALLCLLSIPAAAQTPPGAAVPYRRDRLDLLLVGGTERFHANGRLESARLARSATIQGLRIKDAVSLAADGRLASGLLDGDQRIAGRLFKGSSTLALDGSGAVAYGDLVADTAIGGCTVRGYPRTTYFYPSGRLREGYLAHDQIIARIEARADALFDLYESGAPRSAELARAQKVGPAALPAGARVYLRTDGTLEEARLSGVFEHGGVKLGNPTSSDATEIRFHPNGALLTGRAAVDQVLRGIPVPAGSTLFFSTAGRIEGLFPSRPVRVHGVELAKDLRFDAQGHLEKGWLSSAQTIGGITFRADYGEVEFHPNGRLRAGTISAAAQSVQGVRVMPSTRIELHQSGKLSSAILAARQRIRGLDLANSGLIPLPSGDGPQRSTLRGVELYASGALRRGYLARDQVVGGWLFHGGMPRDDSPSPRAEEYLIELYEDGRPRTAALAPDQVVDGKRLGPGRVWLDAKGKVVRFEPSGPTSVR